MMVAPPVAAVDLLYPASHMLRSRRLRLLPPTALHLQTPTLWPSPLHTLLEREYDLGAWLRMGCSSTSSRPRSLVDYSGAFRHQYTRSVVVRTQAHHGLVALLNRPRAHVSQVTVSQVSLFSLLSSSPIRFSESVSAVWCVHPVHDSGLHALTWAPSLAQRRECICEGGKVACIRGLELEDRKDDEPETTTELVAPKACLEKVSHGVRWVSKGAAAKGTQHERFAALRTRCVEHRPDA